MLIEVTPKEKPKVNAKTLKLHLKVCDRFTASLVDDQGNKICDHDDYVPSFMPGDHYGDYVILDIDIDTGNITNWSAPDKDTLSEWVEACNESDD